MQYAKLIRQMIGHNAKLNNIAPIQSFLSGRKQWVAVNNAISESAESSVGVPQGSVTGPVYWLILAGDLQPPTPTVKYEDDTTSFITITTSWVTNRQSTRRDETFSLKPEHQGIQHALHYSQNWCDQNDMQLNAKKTQLINNSLLKSVNIRDEFSVANERIDTVTAAKFLGVTIDCHLTFKAM